MNARQRARTLVTGAVVSSACLMASACSTAGGSSATSASGAGANALPATVNIRSITDLTGPAAFAGGSQNKGAQVAVDEINSSGFLSGTKIELSSKDTANSAQTAATAIREAIGDKSVSAVLGTSSSSQSVAVAPVAQSGKIPTVFTESAVDGVLLGAYTFRMSEPLPRLYDKVGSYLASKNVKTISILYNSVSPALTEIARTSIPDLAAASGMKVLSTNAVVTTTTDFAAPAAKLMADKPDAVALLVIGAQNATAVTQLRLAGFTGQIVAQPGAGVGNLKPAGAAGVGVFWPNDFSSLQQTPGVQKFNALYQAKFTDPPNNYAAEGYDAMWMIARAVKQVQSSDREAIQKGLDQVAASGFDGAMGRLTFENRDLRQESILLQWDGQKETLLQG